MNDNFIADKSSKVLVFATKHETYMMDSIKYTLGNPILIEDINNQKEDAKIIKFINASNAKQVIFFNGIHRYRQIIPYINSKKRIKFIFTSSISNLTYYKALSDFNLIMEHYDRDIIEKIGVTDDELYKVLKRNYSNISCIAFDNISNKKSNNKSKTIGLLSNDVDSNNNVYNQLSALTLADYDKVKLIVRMAITKPFMELFGIKYEIVTSIDKVIYNNFVNIYINFTNTNVELVLKSMDAGIPCILGNTTLFDDYPILKENLVLKSDDDINEIADKIKNIDSVRGNILEEYKKFRKSYSAQSEKLIKEFLE